MKLKPGDLISYDLFPHQGIPAVGVVTRVHPTPNWHSGIDCIVEILESNGQKRTYDVYRSEADTKLKVLRSV